MKYLLFVILSTIVLLGFGQGGNEGNQIEKEKIIDYYNNGQIKEIKYQCNGEFVDSVLVFDKQGTIIQKGFFNNNTLHLRDTLKNLILIADYKGQFVHGWMKTFYTSGALRSIGEYDLGTKNGIQLLFYENGLVETKEYYRKGLLDGVGASYFETGILKRQTHFKQGKVNGIFIQYYSNGRVKHQGEYHESKPVGEHFYYEEDGKLKEKKSFK